MTREWDLGKNDKDKDSKDNNKLRRDERPMDKRRHRSPEKSPEPGIKLYLFIPQYSISNCMTTKAALG